MIFDTDSAAGTYVNNVMIREHRLQPGDVIRLGKISMVYLEDDHELDSPTESIDPVP
jgi:pSer/pThr/pTyr-binding forkhead associated (FHA) protein